MIPRVADPPGVPSRRRLPSPCNAESFDSPAYRTRSLPPSTPVDWVSFIAPVPSFVPVPFPPGPLCFSSFRFRFTKVFLLPSLLCIRPLPVLPSLLLVFHCHSLVSASHTPIARLDKGRQPVYYDAGPVTSPAIFCPPLIPRTFLFVPSTYPAFTPSPLACIPLLLLPAVSLLRFLSGLSPSDSLLSNPSHFYQSRSVADYHTYT